MKKTSFKGISTSTCKFISFLSDLFLNLEAIASMSQLKQWYIEIKIFKYNNCSFPSPSSFCQSNRQMGKKLNSCYRATGLRTLNGILWMWLKYSMLCKKTKTNKKQKKDTYLSLSLLTASSKLKKNKFKHHSHHALMWTL